VRERSAEVSGICPAPISLNEEDGVYPEALYYEIRVGGHLADRWAAWFDGLSLTRMEDGTTRLVGHLADQAALYGLLERMRDLGLSLLSLNCARPEGGWRA
jgi:hypothetical protein